MNLFVTSWTGRWFKNVVLSDSVIVKFYSSGMYYSEAVQNRTILSSCGGQFSSYVCTYSCNGDLLSWHTSSFPWRTNSKSEGKLRNNNETVLFLVVVIGVMIVLSNGLPGAAEYVRSVAVKKRWQVSLVCWYCMEVLEGPPYSYMMLGSS